MRNRFGDTIPDANTTPEPYVFQAFPSVRYHISGKSQTVSSAEEEAALGEGWSDTPPAVVVAVNPDCPSCLQLIQEKAEMMAKFDASWNDLKAENEKLKAQLNQAPLPEAQTRAAKK